MQYILRGFYDIGNCEAIRYKTNKKYRERHPGKSTDVNLNRKKQNEGSFFSKIEALTNCLETNNVKTENVAMSPND